MDSETSIAEMLRRHREATGDTYAEIARKTGLYKAIIGRLFIKTTPHQLHRSTIEKLSQGLGIPRHLVEAAALETADVQYRPAEMYERREAVLLAQFSTLPPALQDALIDIAETLNGAACDCECGCSCDSGQRPAASASEDDNG